MANVKFKRGLQNGLFNKDGSVKVKEDGVFYLTTDSNRLYVGDGNGLNLLNQTVQFVEDLNHLPGNKDNSSAIKNINDFYYVKRQNILAVYTIVDGVEQWVQINPDKNTTMSKEGDAVKIEVNGSDGLKITLTDSTEATYSDTLALSASGGLSLDYTNGLSIAAESYGISSSSSTNGANLTVASSGSSYTSSVEVIGSGATTVTRESNGNIKINSKDTTLKDGTTSIDLTDGVLKVTVKDSDGNTATDSTGKLVQIPYGKNSSATANLGGALSVYTISEVDNLINGLNGMTFRGTVGSSVSTRLTLPTTNVQRGDVYMVSGTCALAQASSADGTAHSGQSGDLFIASSGDETGGYITEGLQWSYVPSGDDLSNTTYNVLIDNDTKRFFIRDDSENNIGSILVSAGTGVTVTPSIADNDDNELTYTVAHDSVTCTPVDHTTSNVLNNKTEITAVSSITVNSQGHITGYTTQKTTLREYELQEATNTVEALTGNTSKTVANAAIALQDKYDTTYGTANVKLITSSLKFTDDATNSAIGIDIEWGTF